MRNYLQKNKRALIFSVGVLFILVFALLQGLFVMYGARDDTTGRIGLNQFALYGASFTAESLMLEVDQAAEYSSCNAINTILESAGVDPSIGCGKTTFSGKEYVIWENPDLRCVPHIGNFSLLFEKEFRQSMKEYVDKIRSRIPERGVRINPMDYSVSLEPKGDLLVVRGFAIGDITVNVRVPEPENRFGATSGGYNLKPNTKQEIDFNFNDFQTIIEFAGVLKEECEKKPTKEKYLCINEKVDSFKSENSDDFSVILQTHEKYGEIHEDMVFLDFVFKNADHYCISSYDPMRIVLLVPTKIPQKIKSISVVENDEPHRSKNKHENAYTLQRGIRYDFIIEPTLISEDTVLEVYLMKGSAFELQGEPLALQRVNDVQRYLWTGYFIDNDLKSVQFKLVDKDTKKQSDDEIVMLNIVGGTPGTNAAEPRSGKRNRFSWHH